MPIESYAVHAEQTTCERAIDTPDITLESGAEIIEKKGG